MKLKIVSLFSGCGGLDVGFERTNSFEAVWANDLYAPACRTFARNFKMKVLEEATSVEGSVFWGNVEEVDFSSIAPLGEIDVLTGGPPCQDFSVIRGAEKRKGIHVKRGRLYTHFVRALVTLQPKAFVFENVKGLASANAGIALAHILEDFEHLNLRWPEVQRSGVGVAEGTERAEGFLNYRILFSSIINFSKLGVPQDRKRIIIIGLRKDLAEKLVFSKAKQRVASGLPNPNDLFFSFPLTPIEVFFGRPLLDLQEEYVAVMRPYEEAKKVRSVRAREYFPAVWGKYTFEVWHDYLLANNLAQPIDEGLQGEVMERHKEVLKELGYYGRPVEKLHDEDGSNQILKEMERVKARMRFIPPGENHKFVRRTPYEVVGLMSNIYRRLHPLKPSPTVIAGGGGGTWGYHYLRERQRLTNRERARVQTFPDNFLFSGSAEEVRRQIGEAVPPLASKRIAEAVLPLLQKVG